VQSGLRIRGQVRAEPRTCSDSRILFITPYYSHSAASCTRNLFPAYSEASQAEGSSGSVSSELFLRLHRGKGSRGSVCSQSVLSLFSVCSQSGLNLFSVCLSLVSVCSQSGLILF